MTANESLLNAALRGDIAGIQAACAAGANIDSRDEWGDSALIIAVRNKHVPTVLELLAREAPVNCHDRFENTPLHYAAAYGLIEAIDALLESGAAINATNIFGATPLHSAADWHQPSAARRLLERGADRMLADKEGKIAGEDCTLPAVRAELGLDPLPLPSSSGFWGKLFLSAGSQNNTPRRG